MNPSLHDIDSGNDNRKVERQSPGAEARAFIQATRNAWPKDLEIMEEAAIDGQRIDLVLVSRKKNYLTCEVRRLGRPGSYSIESAAARAAIWMKDGALGTNTLLLIVPELSKRTMMNVTQGLNRIRTSVDLRNIAIFSHRGGHLLDLADWNLRSEIVDAAVTSVPTTSERNGTAPAFSEANEQLLKVLLYETVRAGNNASDLVRTWWPRHPEPLVSLDKWAEATEVGRTTAYRLYQQLRDLGWISEVDGITPLRLSNLPRLLAAWLQAERSAPPRQLIPLIPLYPAKGTASERDADVVEWLTKLGHQVRNNGGMLALSGWRALENYNLGIVVGKRPYTVEVPLERYVPQVTEAVLVSETKTREPWAYLGVMRRWRAVAMGAVPRESNRLIVVDPWQAALDVVGDPNRGFEQAEAISRRFIDLAGKP